ncbi:MAG: hypothetical protein ABGY41_03475 [Candidatus Poribacteria bacterium]
MAGAFGALIVWASLACQAAILPVTEPPANPLFPTSVPGRDGGFLVVWEDRRGADPDLYGQACDAEGSPLWESGGRPLAAWPRTQEQAITMADGDGGFFLAWLDSRDNRRDIYLQHYDATGRPMWLPEDGRPICTHPDLKANHRLVPDGRGGVYITWTDLRTGLLDVYGQRVTGAGTRLWEADGRYICRADGHQYDPITSADGAGGVVVVWTDIVDSRFRVTGQRMSGEGHRLWREDGVPACLARSHQGSPVVVESDDGSALVFWVDYRHDDGSYTALDVYGQRLTPEGHRAWGPGGIRLCEADGSQRNIVGVSDGEGGAYVAWVDTRDTSDSSSDDIYVQRVDADGALLWGADARPVGVGPGVQRGPVVSVRDGHLWVAWHDYRRETGSETLQDIYAQSYDPAGVAAFEPGGTPIVTEQADRTDLAVHALGATAWILWTDHHGPRRRVHAGAFGP